MNSGKKNLAVFVSGTGSNFLAIQKEIIKNKINGRIVLVISSKEGVLALSTAEGHHIDHYVMEEKRFGSEEAYSAELLKLLTDHKVDYILLAGYLKKIPSPVIARFKGRVLNIHPALLPKYGGQGMYGLHVHKAVLNAKEEYSGVTIHIVDEEYDRGPIILQKKVKVKKGDTPESLQKRVLQQEHILYPHVVKLLCQDRIKIKGNKVVIE